jgi:hypothetical protein
MCQPVTSVKVKMHMLKKGLLTAQFVGVVFRKCIGSVARNGKTKAAAWVTVSQHSGGGYRSVCSAFLDESTPGLDTLHEKLARLVGRLIRPISEKLQPKLSDTLSSSFGIGEARQRGH